MTTQEVADTLATWTTLLIPEFVEAQAHPAQERADPFPDLAVEVVSVERVDEHPDFSMLNIEQSGLVVREFDLILVVAPDPVDMASASLSGMVDRVMDAMADDPWLGGSSIVVGQNVSASFRPPYAQFDDGTRARTATITLRVGDPAAPTW